LKEMLMFLEGLCDDQTQPIYTRQLKIDVEHLLRGTQIKLKHELETLSQTL